MAWDKDRSTDRIKSRWDARDKNLTVSPLSREMDLENVTLNSSRLICGAHIYASVAASGDLRVVDTEEEARKSVQAISAWQREVDQLTAAFGGYRVAFQGGRAHIVIYRPSDDAEKARRATLLAAAIRRMTAESLNPNLDGVTLEAIAGIGFGETVVSRGGTKGDSELIFLGNAANHPAKLIGRAKLAATDALVDSLDETLDCGIVPLSSDGVAITLSEDQFNEALDGLGITWSTSASKARIGEDIDKWPLQKFGMSGASTLIDLSKLSRSDSKLVDVAMIFVDIEGFSAYIEEAENDSTKAAAILTLDAIRQEIRSVLKQDFSGVRVQYQGDNMVGLVHLPADDRAKVAEAAADIAAGIQSSVQDTLPMTVPDAERLEVNIGLAFGQTLVTRTGSHGRRDALVLGAAVSQAEAIQSRLDAKETGLHSSLYELLPEEAQDLFQWNSTAKAWVAVKLDAGKFARALAAHDSSDYRRFEKDPSGVITITSTSSAEEVNSVRSHRPHAR